MKIQTSSLLSLSLMVFGCGGGAEEEGTATPTEAPTSEALSEEEAKAALPSAEQLLMTLPEASAKAPTAVGEVSDFYEMTRNLAQGANNTVYSVLDMIARITSYPSSAQADGKRVWGPWTAELSPVTQLFVMQKNEEADLEYTLLWKAKGASDDTYVPVIAGVIYGGEGAYKNVGSFSIDYDTISELDSSRSAHGVGAFDYNTVNPDRVVKAHLNGVMESDGMPINSKLAFVDYAEAGGELGFGWRADFTGDGTSAMEDLAIHSRWQEDGAGRSDGTITSGDVGTNVLNVSECWDVNFLTSWSVQSANSEVMSESGDASTCVFTDAIYPEL